MKTGVNSMTFLKTTVVVLLLFVFFNWSVVIQALNTELDKMLLISTITKRKQ